MAHQYGMMPLICWKICGEIYIYIYIYISSIRITYFLVLHLLIHWPFLCFFAGKCRVCASCTGHMRRMCPVHDAYVLDWDSSELTKSLTNGDTNDVKRVMGTRCVWYTSNFEVQYAEIQFSVP